MVSKLVAGNEVEKERREKPHPLQKPQKMRHPLLLLRNVGPHFRTLQRKALALRYNTIGRKAHR